VVGDEGVGDVEREQGSFVAEVEVILEDVVETAKALKAGGVVAEGLGLGKAGFKREARGEALAEFELGTVIGGRADFGLLGG